MTISIQLLLSIKIPIGEHSLEENIGTSPISVNHEFVRCRPLIITWDVIRDTLLELGEVCSCGGKRGAWQSCFIDVIIIWSLLSRYYLHWVTIALLLLTTIDIRRNYPPTTWWSLRSSDSWGTEEGLSLEWSWYHLLSEVKVPSVCLCTSAWESWCSLVL